MPSTTRLFGLILIVLGVASYVLTGRTSVTALIPAFFGAVLVVCALVARASESARKHAMHAAVAVGLIGALAALGRGVPAALGGDASQAGRDVAAGDGRVAADLRRARRAVVHRRPEGETGSLIRLSSNNPAKAGCRPVFRGGLKNGVGTTVAVAR